MCWVYKVVEMESQPSPLVPEMRRWQENESAKLAFLLPATGLLLHFHALPTSSPAPSFHTAQ